MRRPPIRAHPRRVRPRPPRASGRTPVFRRRYRGGGTGWGVAPTPERLTLRRSFSFKSRSEAIRSQSERFGATPLPASPTRGEERRLLYPRNRWSAGRPHCTTRSARARRLPRGGSRASEVCGSSVEGLGPAWTDPEARRRARRRSRRLGVSRVNREWLRRGEGPPIVFLHGFGADLNGLAAGASPAARDAVGAGDRPARPRTFAARRGRELRGAGRSGAARAHRRGHRRGASHRPLARRRGRGRALA